MHGEAPAWYERIKPAAGRRAHVTAAALLWTAVGLGLATFGFVQTLGSGGGLIRVALPVAVGLGVAKGRWILSRTARRNVARIERRGEGRCIGGFQSVRGWLLVAVMMLLGRTLRHSGVPGTILGPIYVAVGVALLAGSVPLWRARRDLDVEPTSGARS